MLKRFLCLLLLYGLCCTSVFTQTNFSRILPLEEFNVRAKHIASVDGKYQIGYISLSGDARYSATFITDGQSDTTIIHKDFHLAILRPRTTDPGAIYYLGSNSNVGSSDDAILKKFERDLSHEIWSRNYNMHEPISMKVAVVTAADHIYALTNNDILASTDGPITIGLYKIKQDGSDVNYTTYYEDYRQTFATNMITTAAEDLLIGCYTGDLTDQHPSVLKVDKDGTVLWRYISEERQGLFPSVIAELNSNDILSVASTKVFSTAQWFGLSKMPVLMQWLTPDGTIKNKKYLTQPSGAQLMIYDVDVLDNDDFLLFGHYRLDCQEDISYEYYAHLSKMTSEGDTVWTKNYEHPDYPACEYRYEVIDLVVEENGYASIVVNIFSDTEYKIWLLTVDENGCPPGDEGCGDFVLQDDAVAADKNVSIVYPNPSSGIISIDLDVQRLSLINLNGQEIWSIKDPGDLIDLTHVPVGFYHLAVWLPDGTLRYQKLVLTH